MWPTKEEVLNCAARICKDAELIKSARAVFDGVDWPDCRSEAVENREKVITIRFDCKTRVLSVNIDAKGLVFCMCHDKFTGATHINGNLRGSIEWL